MAPQGMDHCPVQLQLPFDTVANTDKQSKPITYAMKTNVDVLLHGGLYQRQAVS